MVARLLTYAIKNQRKARNAPSRGHFVPKPLVGGFGCLELVLYGIGELALQHYDPLILLQSEISVSDGPFVVVEVQMDH